jgi:hypothetical protein
MSQTKPNQTKPNQPTKHTSQIKANRTISQLIDRPTNQKLTVKELTNGKSTN